MPKCKKNKKREKFIPNPRVPLAIRLGLVEDPSKPIPVTNLETPSGSARNAILLLKGKPPEYQPPIL